MCCQLTYGEVTKRIESVLLHRASLSSVHSLVFLVHLFRVFGGSREVAAMIYRESFENVFSGFLKWFNVSKLQENVRKREFVVLFVMFGCQMLA